ncbi:single-stranded DNA-binding protein [Streptomyces prunicolor]|uniref:Single-stranded DNA-binding protein n=1 Tax=Streptomyces prunicolor TaxID=67348 RepID=A0ABU4FP18_9ACTN|nr:single-stranded DNA-binding protein [Streptomyces prunicolor]MDV7221015.1 single-stranded DNA-binding protein [Streptomyces prunicolor]
MSGETTLTVVGNIVSEPELRFTPAGAAVAKFRIASTPRKFDKQTNAWTDGDPLFLGVSVWRQQAEHVAESVTKGARVVVVGRLTQRSYEDREGVKRTVYEIEADEVAVSLAFATAKITKASGGQQQGSAQSADPWAGAQPANGQAQGGGWGGAQQQQPAAAPAGHPEQAPF